MAFLTPMQLFVMGFKKLGQNVMISDKASFHNCKNISIGANVRIDDGCVLSAGDEGIEIGNYVHIATGAKLVGKGKITMEDFTGLSLNSVLLSGTEPYDGSVLTNPTIDIEDRVIISGDITMKKFSLIGAMSFVMPGVTLEENSCMGAMSFTKKDLEKDSIYAGVPCKKISERKRPDNLEALMLKYSTKK